MRNSTLCALLIASASAFTTHNVPTAFSRNIAISGLMGEGEEDKIASAVANQADLNAGNADTAFAKRFGHLAGKPVKTVGEAFAEFTEELGYSVNALYKNMVTDLVGTTHLIVVNARFEKDGIWCLGILNSLNLLLKNYPEADIAEEIITALFKSVGMDESEVRSSAQEISDWAKGKSKEDIETAMSGEGDGPIAAIAKNAMGDEFWLYSRYFGLGLVSIMDEIGVDMDKDEVYPIMENWMTAKMGKSHLTACADSDLYFRIKAKLDMMETMMKEIEIREKKRMAERLEDKAEAALLAAERDVEYQKEVTKEKAEKAEKSNDTSSDSKETTETV